MELASNLLRFSQEVWLVESTGVATSRYESLRAVSLWITRCHIQDCTDWRGWSWKSWKQDATDATHPAPFYSFHSFHVWLWRIGGNLVAGIGGKRRLEYIGTLCRFCKNAGLKKLEDEQNLGVSRSASPKRFNVYQAICGLMRSVFASMFVVPKSFVLQDFGIRISMKDPWWGELLPRPWWNILTIILFSSSLAEAEQELERINAVMNVKFLALWGLLCHLCQASASSASGGRHGVGSIDFFILPSTSSTKLIFKIAQVLQLRENLRSLGQTAKPQKSDEWKGLQNCRVFQSFLLLCVEKANELEGFGMLEVQQELQKFSPDSLRWGLVHPVESRQATLWQTPSAPLPQAPVRNDGKNSSLFECHTSQDESHLTHSLVAHDPWKPIFYTGCQPSQAFTSGAEAS